MKQEYNWDKYTTNNMKWTRSSSKLYEDSAVQQCLFHLALGKLNFTKFH